MSGTGNRIHVSTSPSVTLRPLVLAVQNSQWSAELPFGLNRFFLICCESIVSYIFRTEPAFMYAVYAFFDCYMSYRMKTMIAGLCVCALVPCIPFLFRSLTSQKGGNPQVGNHWLIRYSPTHWCSGFSVHEHNLNFFLLLKNTVHLKRLGVENEENKNSLW